ncbi:endo-alpha-N-acetylgalactosaminidase family protein [Diaminobutyricibacter sp. McL0608]|uniref:endo-alpha-N-acetylgalactosaminidase family protein n=1 Tax=Leifsonia sp. McL0608 TaxID=3143537 RepID=UPI0031F30033
MIWLRPARSTAVVLSLGLIASAVVGVQSPSRADAADDSTLTIASPRLSVQLAADFPDVLEYTWLPTGGVLSGHEGTAPQVQINGTMYTPSVTSAPAKDHVDYVVAIESIGVTLTARLSVRDDVVDFKITKVDETGATKVTTIGIPGQQLISLNSDQTGATVSDATVYRTNYAPGPDLDNLKSVADRSVETAPHQSSVALFNTKDIAAGVVSNAIQTYGNLLVQTTQASSGKQTSAASNTWTYRGPDGKVVALPEVKVVVTGDRNGDRTLDWQDAAIAYREIQPLPTGAAATKNNVVSQIALNFESQAQNPFIKTLDDIKKVSLLTDGLGQSIELKGYQDQGHDSAHPDFAGHYNEAAGGLSDIQYVVSHAKQYNAIVGVHINDTAEAPRSDAFRWDKTTDPTAPTPAYIYGDTQYAMDMTADQANGDYAARIGALLQQVPDLGFIYSDAFFGEDWNAWKGANAVNSHGIPIYTEFPTYMWPDATWYHDSNEYNDVGINSQILRFIDNSNADAWIQNSQPMLGGEQNNASFMGWHSANSVSKEIAQVFTNNLPTKYLQNFQITKWAANEIDFTGGVKATMNGPTPQIWKDGTLERDGNNIFLPWSAQGEQKIYAWSDSGKSRTWTLPKSWSGQHEVTLYRLTDTGKVKAGVLPVHNGTVSVQIAANTPYVLYPQRPIDAPHITDPTANGSNTGSPVITRSTAQSVDFGAGTIAKDGEFFSGSFQAWTPASSAGNTKGVQIVTDSNGFQNLKISGAAEGQVSQKLTGLKPGHTYAASAYVNVQGHRTATISVSGFGGKAVSASIDAPPPVQDDLDNRLAGQEFQQLKVLFTLPKSSGSSEANLRLIGAASSGSNVVQFTDVRVQLDDGANHQIGGHFYTEDFEHPDGGSFGPFIIGKSSEPSLILSETNPGYTRDTISGKYSLESINNGAGLQYRTWPGTINFQPGHAYRVRLDYQSDATGLYDFQVDADGADAPIVDVPLAQTTDRGLTSAPKDGPKPAGWTDSLPPQTSAPHASIDTTFVAGSQPAYLALNQNSDTNGASTIDNLVVDDLGPAAPTDAGKALSTLTVTPNQLPGGTTSTVTVTFTNTSTEPETSVHLSLAAPDGWATNPTSSGKAANVPDGGTATATYDVAVPSQASAGDNVLTARADYSWNGKAIGVAMSTNAQVAYGSLADAYNNVGITDDAKTASGAFDGSGGDSFSAQSLAAAGATPGATITHDGTAFSWPDVPSGEPDNVSAEGQTISINGSGALAVLGSATTAVQGTIIVTYTDGSSSSAVVGLPSWTGDNLSHFGSQVVIDSDGNNSPAGHTHQGTHYDVFYNTVPLDDGKTVKAVTLPDAPNLHLFAMTTKKFTSPPPTADVYASDLQWTSTTNGWGSVERDHSLGEDLAGDGNAITLGGTVYPKGLGAAPFAGTPAVITYDLGGKCTSLTATIGLDHEEPARGSVAFAVVADGATVFSSGAFTPATAPQTITVPLTGAHTVQLQTNDGGDGNGNDHGDWANAMFHCGS